jgi:hypothetical protein
VKRRRRGGRERRREYKGRHLGCRAPFAAGAAESIPEPPRAVVRGGGRRRRRGKIGPRRPGAVDLPRASWKPELLRKDTDVVNPEDRSASAAMDALNVDHHMFGRMPEQ